MKNIDLRSMIIGMLATALFFTCTASKSGNLGHITVDSIEVVDENGAMCLEINHGGMMIGTPRDQGKVIIAVGLVGEGGSIMTTNPDGKMTTFIGSSKIGGGYVQTYRSDGTDAIFLGSGYLHTYNDRGVMVGYFGADKTNDGIITLSDRYGEHGWGEHGKK